jgi:hypothetical protein
MATSFPFLKIARERNIPYEVVIRCVQALEDADFKTLLDYEKSIPDLRTRAMIIDAVNNEQHRRQGITKYE